MTTQAAVLNLQVRQGPFQGGAASEGICLINHFSLQDVFIHSYICTPPFSSARPATGIPQDHDKSVSIDATLTERGKVNTSSKR